MLARAYPYDDAAGHLGDLGTAPPSARGRAADARRATGARRRGLRITTRTIADTSPSRALHILAEIERASLVVIGSSHRGAVGRVFAGTTAERLLHGAPCLVAVAPRGTARGEEISRIAVGWDGSAEATAALDAAVAIARAVGAELRVVEVLDIQWAGTPAIIPGRVRPSRRTSRLRAPASASTRSFPACRRMRAEAAVMMGDPVGDLVGESEDADLLVLGSRGYGPRRAVLLGGVSGRMVRKSACPVIVVPRGVERPLEDLFPPVSQMEPAPPAA